ncbi:hypothetical protein [Demequina litorisediminis]|uniref:hypothetical protein n=1 Tax=Demequina litorisediminis TaxID=1849022 RepID=UPI0024E06597|nr:hypothetical protein [Demequina litorisediminis]
MRRKGLTAAAVTVAGALLLAACSSDGSGGNASEDPDTSGGDSPNEPHVHVPRLGRGQGGLRDRDRGVRGGDRR